MRSAITAPPLVDERAFRGSGCDQRCTVVRALIPGTFGRSELLLHDAGAHEEFGALRADVGTGGRTGATVATGGLAIDLDRLLAAVDGREISLTGTETRLLVLAARRLDGIVTYEEAAYVVWGTAAMAMPRPSWTHALTVHISRLRRRLHPWEGLLETAIGLGFRLRAVDAPGAPPPYAPLNHRARVVGWAIKWARCRTCGTTAIPHDGLGDCQRCANQRRRAARPKGRFP